VFRLLKIRFFGVAEGYESSVLNAIDLRRRATI
jgi:hypothetical protein